MSIRNTAKSFFETCETGKGWGGCSQYCLKDASFSAQTNALADVSTLVLSSDGKCYTGAADGTSCVAIRSAFWTDQSDLNEIADTLDQFCTCPRSRTMYR